MGIENPENLTQDFQVMPGGDISRRRDHHSRGERQARLPRSGDMSAERDLERFHQAVIEDALYGSTIADEPQVEDIAPDWQALQQYGATPSESAYRPEESEPPQNEYLTEAQQEEVEQAETLRYFGQFGSGRR